MSIWYARIKQGINKKLVLMGSISVLILGGCVGEQVALPQDSQIHNQTSPKNKHTPLSTQQKPLPATIQESNQKPSYSQAALEKIVGEQSTGEVRDNGRTFRAEITYKPGTKIKHGKEVLYYLNGTMAQRAFYVDGKKEDVFEIFSEKGILIYQAHYSAGQLNGLCRMFDVANGNIKSEMNFVRGIQEGQTNIYNTAGKLWYQLQYKQGKKEGVAKEFDENGRVVREVRYANDKEIK
ncbi:toxin-antitoxin system YwqK family antitoxin [Helicobacter sp. MIT 21-1697]|uniref:toxin-antitoxin system YwqK family antitoxin n=1 Tax=Helicobacter sp. MIT 21-1697 TaxID=2993733 RepID=UPI00224AC4E7|nr:toxin-antitoxin system YwqK family antitoxin [Helicobacter sp. MIT 21-1697]MCX2716288.1 toxin-antitoxin system YwqK family antitoxin [Helicobacter sp. MIT 21-1697]